MIVETQHERIEQYDDVAHMVRELRKLLDRPRHCAPRSADWQRQAQRSGGRSVFDWTPLDNVGEVGVLLTVLREARAEIDLCHPEAGERMWRAWLEVRFDGKTLREYPAGYRKSAAGVAVAAVDEQVGIELAVRGKLTRRGREPYSVEVFPSNKQEAVRYGDEVARELLALVYPSDTFPDDWGES